jgi:hypothetical protein
MSSSVFSFPRFSRASEPRVCILIVSRSDDISLDLRDTIATLCWDAGDVRRRSLVPLEIGGVRWSFPESVAALEVFMVRTRSFRLMVVSEVLPETGNENLAIGDMCLIC